MSLFESKWLKPFARSFSGLVLCAAAFSVSGCASGPLRAWNGWVAARGPSEPTPAQGPMPFITPGTPPSPPIESGPVILPRDSFRQPPGHSQAQRQWTPEAGSGASPVIAPRYVPSPVSAPVIRHTSPPAEFSGGIEIVPNSQPVEPTSSRKLYDIVPNEPAASLTEEVEFLPSPASRRYEELPPPPE